jgi:hypothetical protein
MKRLIGLMLMFLVVNAYAQQVNDPNAEVRQVSAFHGIKVSNAFDVYLSQSNSEAVAVSASETEYRDRIKVEVKNGILEVYYDNKGKWPKGNKKLKAYISFKQIDLLSISGACDVVVTGTINGSNLDINLSGASDLKGKLVVKNLKANMSGASDMNVTGSADRIDVDASGASSFRGFEFVTDYCDLRASGASDIRITVNKEVTAHASGASDVDIKGEGVVKEQKTSGASSINKSRS